jgi:hypothetical protein
MAGINFSQGKDKAQKRENRLPLSFSVKPFDFHFRQLDRE